MSGCSCLLQTRPVRKRTVVHHKQLTQDELLAEAARTEVENLKDLEVMVAMEEATKKKATAKKAKYSGPMVRFHSRKVDGAGVVRASSSSTRLVCGLPLTGLLRGRDWCCVCCLWVPTAVRWSPVAPKIGLGLQ